MTDLKELQGYYEQNLTDRIFRYTLANGVVIEISFYRESFCHLLGIQHVTKNRRYIGKSGYERIYSGKLTIETLKLFNLGIVIWLSSDFAKLRGLYLFDLLSTAVETGRFSENQGKRKVSDTRWQISLERTRSCSCRSACLRKLS